MLKANQEYLKYTERSKNELSPVQKHFLESIDTTAKQLKEKKDSPAGKKHK